MKVVDISKFEDSVVLHFETEGHRINAYTLASTLVSLADAAKAANSQLNPGYDIEIIVEALGGGSFRARIRAYYRKNRTLFSSTNLILTVVLGVLGNYIYERTLAVDDKVKVEIKTDEVVIQRGDEKIIVPRKVYDATRQAERNPEFRNAISQTFEAIKHDEKIRGFGMTRNMDDPPPQIIVNKDTIERLAVPPTPDSSNTRVVTEIVELVILKAILERGDRKWEFVWRGVRISAPIVDQSFYNRFFDHTIKIAPGDLLKVKLGMNQRRDPDTGIYANDSYTVLEVFEHVPRPQQADLSLPKPQRKRRKS